MRCVNTCTDARDCPRDGECREVDGAGISFCFAPTREDGGIDAAPGDASVDAGMQSTDVGIDAGPSTDGGGVCTDASCAIDLCVGESFACAVRGDHAVFCWGANHVGQLGDGTNASTPSMHAGFSCPDLSGTSMIDCSPRPVRVLGAGGPLMADAIACTSGAVCAREQSTGAVLCWGAGGNGELGGSSTAPAFRAQAVTGVPSDPLSLSGGRAFFCTTYASPTNAVCWGDDSSGQFGLPMTATGNPLAAPHWNGQTLVTGGVNTCGLRGNVVQCAGDDTYGQTGPMTLVDGGVQYGPVTVPLPSGAVTSLVAGDSFECALVDGIAHCWGFALTGSLGRNATFTCGGSACDPHPARVDGTTTFDTLWVEGETSRICGRSGADTWCWGQYSQIGCEAGAACMAPRVIPQLAHATQVAASSRSLCAIVGGQVVCSGNDAFGQLGRGNVATTLNGITTDYLPVCLGSGC
jgi:alpha-tubulin suppressor-like RCC1 family protein